MIDHGAEPVSDFEARLASRMQRWTDHGVIAIDAALIAGQANTVAGRARTPRWWPRSRTRSRALVLGLVALLTLALALALAAGSRLLQSDVDPYRAVVVREVDGGAVDIVLAQADGRERLLRHVTQQDLGIDPRYRLGLYGLGGATDHGWLELWASPTETDRTGLERNGLMALINLADRTRAPIILPANGFTSGRWGPNGEYALFFSGNINLGQARVLDLDHGIDSEIIVPTVQTFGGGPEIFWAADGSGFLAQQGTVWGIRPLDGGPFRLGAPTLLSRDTNVVRPDLDDPGGWAIPGGDTGLAPATPVSAHLAADREAIWQLLDDPTGSSPRALLARLSAPGVVESIRTVELPARPARDFQLAPDDTFGVIYVDNASGDGWEPVLAPIGADDTTATAGPVIHGAFAGLVPASTADTWPGI